MTVLRAISKTCFCVLIHCPDLSATSIRCDAQVKAAITGNSPFALADGHTISRADFVQCDQCGEPGRSRQVVSWSQTLRQSKGIRLLTEMLSTYLFRTKNLGHGSRGR